MRRIRTSDKFVVPRKMKKNVFELPIEQTVYVPSTSGMSQKHISKKQLDSRVNDVRRYLSKNFGGYTSVEGTGGYLQKMGKGKGKIIKEAVVKVTSFSTRNDYRKHHNQLIKQIGKWDRKWKQESIGYEQEGDLFYISSPKRRKMR